MADQSPLSEQDRARLDTIVHQMETNGETPAYVQSVVDDFKQKYAAPHKQPVAAAPDPGFLGGMADAAKQIITHPIDTLTNTVIPASRASGIYPGPTGELDKVWQQEQQAPGSSVVGLAAGIAPELSPFTGPIANWMARAALAGTAGAGAEAAREKIVKGNVDSSQVARTGAGQAAIQGTGDAISGGIAAIGPALKRGAVSVINRIAKPTNSMLEGAGSEWGASQLDRAHNLAESVLKDRIPFSQEGANVIRDKMATDQQAAQDLVKNSTARVSTDPVVRNLEEGATAARRNQTTPEGTGAASPWESKLAEVQSNPLITKTKRSINTVWDPAARTPQAGQGPMPPAQRVEVSRDGREILPTVPIQVSERLKAGDYRRLGDVAYGELKGPEIEASKAVARGWKEGGDLAEPKLQPINQRIGRAIDQRDYIEGASKRIGQHNILDLMTTLAAVAKNPALAAVTLSQRAGIGAPLSQAAYNLGSWLPKGNPGLANLWRLAMLTHLSSPDQDQSKQP